MNLDETLTWASGILPEDPTVMCRAIGPSFPEFHVAEVMLEAPGVRETVAMTLDASRIEVNLEVEDGSDLRVEFITVVLGAGSTAGELVTAAATMISEAPDMRSPQPGMLLHDLGDAVNANLTARHGLLVVPFLWDDGVPQVQEVPQVSTGRHANPTDRAVPHIEFTHPGRLTVPIQVVMLTDAEVAMLQEHGIAHLQQELVSRGVNLNDPFRR